MQGQHYAAGAQLNAFSDGGKRRAEHRRIRIKSATFMKVTLWCPDRGEAMPVREFCAFQIKPVFVCVQQFVNCGEVEETSIICFSLSGEASPPLGLT